MAQPTPTPEPISAPTPTPPGEGSQPNASHQSEPQSIERVEQDPLVRSVIEIFDGDIKRVHPKNN